MLLFFKKSKKSVDFLSLHAILASRTAQKQATNERLDKMTKIRCNLHKTKQLSLWETVSLVLALWPNMGRMMRDDCKEIFELIDSNEVQETWLVRSHIEHPTYIRGIELKMKRSSRTFILSRKEKDT